jgi:hypothetical protein
MTGLGAPLLASAPWLLVVALCFAAAASPVPRARSVAALFALTLATGVGRWLLVPFNFFHQNGHGPEHVERAIGAISIGFGPGEHELFHGAIALAPRDPEASVAAVQSLLAMLSPACAWMIARAVGARGALPWALAVAVALDPMLARLARSESYLSAGSSLAFIALALTARAGVATWRRPSFLLLAVAAGAVVAQAARLHPWLWAASATAPLPLLLARGAPRRRLSAALAATLAIALTTLVTSGRAMWAAAHDDLASRLSDTLLWSLPGRLQGLLPPVLIALVALVARSRHRRSAGLAALAAALTFALFTAADLPAATHLRPWIHGAYARLYLPAWVALVAWALRDLDVTVRRSWAAAPCGALLVLGLAWARFPVERTIPVDAQEQALARGWRQQLPQTETLLWLARADVAVLRLPIYPHDDPNAPHLLPADPERLIAPHESDRRPQRYYRSSLCSTAAGAAACARFEATHRLTPIATWTLPATPSYVFEYVTPSVRVGLYRVEDDGR